jgi:hypothetical protein
MLKVKISAGSPRNKDLLLRQIPGKSNQWRGFEFLVNSKDDECDFWIVCHESGLEHQESVLCDPNNIFYLSMEPSEDVCRVNDKFLSQFSKIVTCDEKRCFNNKILMNVSTWWVGMNMKSINGIHILDEKYTLDYDLLSNGGHQDRLNKVSLIVSNKRSLKGHRQRLDAIEKLVSRPIGKNIDLFGVGFNHIQDKYDVISNYKYHLIFENELKANYWSEKLGDAFLGLSYPIYSGCTNIKNFFDQESILEINRFDIDDMERKIELALDNDYHKKNFEKIQESKKLILNKYNLFNIISDLCAGQNVGEKRLVTLLPNKDYARNLTKKIYWKYKSIAEKFIQ